MPPTIQQDANTEPATASFADEYQDEIARLAAEAQNDLDRAFGAAGTTGNDEAESEAESEAEAEPAPPRASKRTTRAAAPSSATKGQASSAASAPESRATPARDEDAEASDDAPAVAGDGGDGGENDEAALLERLKGIDPDKLLKAHPRLSHRLGALADKQAKGKAEELRKAEEQVARQHQELADLQAQVLKAREDPLTFAEEFAGQAEQQLTAKQQAEQAQRDQAALEARLAPERQQLYADLSQAAGAVLARFQEGLDPEVVQALAGKTYEGLWHEGFDAYLRDAVQAQAAALAKQQTGQPAKADPKALDAEVTRRTAALQKENVTLRERLKALEADAEAAALADEPTPDVDGGTSVGGRRRRFTLGDIEKMPPAEFAKNQSDILDALFGAA